MRRGDVVKGRGAFYDTSVLTAFLFGEEDRFEIFREVLEKHVTRAISIISIHEIHACCLKFGVEERFAGLKEILHKLFKIVLLDQGACIEASYMRKVHELPEIDSLMLATAVRGGYGHFYTFDRDFEKLNGNKLGATVIHYLG